MSTFQRLLIAGILSAGALSPIVAQAAVSYSYVTDQSAYTAASVGDTVNVQVFLKETLTADSTSLIAADTGLYSYGFKVTTTGNSTINTASFVNNPIFSGNIGTDGANSTSHLAEAANLPNSASTGPTPDSTTQLLLLGSFNITAGSGISQFTLGQFNTIQGNTLTLQGNDLDANSASPAFTGAAASTTPFSVSVASPIPEPASLSLAALGSAALLLRRRRHA